MKLYITCVYVRDALLINIITYDVSGSKMVVNRKTLGNGYTDVLIHSNGKELLVGWTVFKHK